jgi:hypothetical protein
VDIGSKAPAFLPSRVGARRVFRQGMSGRAPKRGLGVLCCRLQEVNIDPGVKVQDVVRLDEEMEFQVISDGDEEGVAMLSLKRMQYER